MRCDIDGIVCVIALFFHQGNHDGADGRDVGQRRTGNAAKNGTSQHIAHAESAPNMSNQAVGKFNNAIGDATVEHEFASKDKKWYG